MNVDQPGRWRVNAYSLAAIRGIQAGRAYYVIMVPLCTLGRLFSLTRSSCRPRCAPSAISTRRAFRQSRATSPTSRVNEYVLSALSATIDGGFVFESVPGQRSVGTLPIDMSATLLINDGQHRRADIVEALRERPALGDETIAVTLFPDEGLSRSQQMFVDLNQHGVKPARSLRLFYDGRDEFARLSRAVADAIPLFREMTDFTRSNLPAGSRKLFAFSNLHTAIATLVSEAALPATPEEPEAAVEF